MTPVVHSEMEAIYIPEFPLGKCTSAFECVWLNSRSVFRTVLNENPNGRRIFIRKLRIESIITQISGFNGMITLWKSTYFCNYGIND
jgi:hypothetical protein